MTIQMDRGSSSVCLLAVNHPALRIPETPAHAISEIVLRIRPLRIQLVLLGICPMRAINDHNNAGYARQIRELC
jgi:hypothetical protein